MQSVTGSSLLDGIVVTTGKPSSWYWEGRPWPSTQKQLVSGHFFSILFIPSVLSLSGRPNFPDLKRSLKLATLE